MNDLEYFNFLKNRSWFSFWFRRNFMLKKVLKECDGSLLDVGCGLGELLSLYLKDNQSKEVWGIDINQHCVEYCCLKELPVIKGDAENIPFYNDNFDCVICSHVLEHLKNPDKAIKEMHRVLKPKGKLIIIVPTNKSFHDAPDKTHITFFDEERLEILKDFGFKKIKSFYQPFNEIIAKEILRGELIVISEKNE